MKVVSFTLLILISAAWLHGETPKLADQAHSMRAWLTHLSSDEMGGRAEGTPGAEKASAWLAEQFAALGLTKPPGQDSYFQAFQSKSKGHTYASRNVIGWLPGNDPKLKDEYVIISAHYDHVGPAKEGEDRIHNGADDNGSGVVMMLSLAKQLKDWQATKQGPSPKRSIVFICWAAEEIGLQGSRYYASNPLFPLAKTVTNLNFEMVGHSSKTGKSKAWMTGAAFSDLKDVLEPVFAKQKWELDRDPFPDMKLFFRSDNVSLAMLQSNRKEHSAKGIPAHSFSTWGGENHYHQVFDDVSGIDFDNMAGLSKVFSNALILLANRDAWIAWKDNKVVQFERISE